MAKKFHTDINKDPTAAEILKKIIEAYGVLSNPMTRQAYDNSEAECPTCFTHEVLRASSSLNTPQWSCRHCGCKFGFYEYAEQKKVKENLEQTSIICPRCKQPLLFDNFLLLYRCSNSRCKGVFSRADLVRSKSIKVVKKPAKPSVDEYTLPAELRLVLKATIVVSLIMACSLLFFFYSNPSLLMLGLFLFFISFTLFSWWIYKYPRVIKYIKSLVIR